MSKRKYIKVTEEDLKRIVGIDLTGRGIVNGTLYILYSFMCFMEYQYIGKNSDWFASIDDIKKEAMQSRDSVIRGIKILEELGLLRVIRHKYSKETGKRTEVNHYKILGSTMANSDKESKPQSAEEPRVKKLKEQPAQVNKAIETKVEPKKDNHSNPNPPKTNDKAIESQPEVKDETPTPHIVNSGLPDDRASKAVFIMYDKGMKESKWLRALGSKNIKEIDKCRGPYMGYVPQAYRDYLDNYLDEYLKAA